MRELAERVTISLPPELLRDLRACLDDGEYASLSELVREALRSWKVDHAVGGAPVPAGTPIRRPSRAAARRESREKARQARREAACTAALDDRLQRVAFDIEILCKVHGIQWLQLLPGSPDAPQTCRLAVRFGKFPAWAGGPTPFLNQLTDAIGLHVELVEVVDPPADGGRVLHDAAAVDDQESSGSPGAA